jgi:regulator of protease activity HflC (stomatin/prohibitin superfamily)
MFARAKPNEFLVVVRRGRLVNRGVGGRAFLWPGMSFTLVPGTKQEACFAFTQETRDGIPLRFKGIVIYRVTAPEVAARLFDFTSGRGHEEITSLICHVCMGELRAVVSHLTMAECIEGRETALTSAVASTLREVVQGGAEGDQS